MSGYFCAGCYLISGAAIVLSNKTSYQPSLQIIKCYWNLLKMESSPFPQVMFIMSPFLIPVMAITLPILSVSETISKHF